jgi:hypothetical protein
MGVKLRFKSPLSYCFQAVYSNSSHFFILKGPAIEIALDQTKPISHWEMFGSTVLRLGGKLVIR